MLTALHTNGDEGQLARSPLVQIDHLAALFLKFGLVLFDDRVEASVTDLRVDDADEFVFFIHLFSLVWFLKKPEPVLNEERRQNQ